MSNQLWNKWKKHRVKFRKSHSIYIVDGDAEFTRFCNYMHQRANHDKTRGLVWFNFRTDVTYTEVMSDKTLIEKVMEYSCQGVSAELINGEIVLKSGGVII